MALFSGTIIAFPGNYAITNRARSVTQDAGIVAVTRVRSASPGATSIAIIRPRSATPFLKPTVTIPRVRLGGSPNVTGLVVAVYVSPTYRKRRRHDDEAFSI